jgi:hypothetical protein
MILGVPTLDGHDWTQKLVASLMQTVAEPGDFRLVILDDASTEPYKIGEFPDDCPFPIEISRSEKVEGYYYPLRALDIETRDNHYAQDKFVGLVRTLNDRESVSDPLVGLVHNDIVFYERGWDVRMKQAFVQNHMLGLVGLCGSNEIDMAGGRGGGTMCYFRGLAQLQSAGRRVTGLEPAVVLDSLFMMFRRTAIRDLRIEQDRPTLAHFYDKIWPLRLIQKGWRVAVLGSEVDHWGGITCVANPRFTEACHEWCKENNLHTLPMGTEVGNWNLVMYQEAERRMFNEFRGKLIPAKVESDWSLVAPSVPQSVPDIYAGGATLPAPWR